MTFRLPETIASSQDLNAVITEVKAYATWYMHESIKARVSKKSSGLKNEPELSKGAADVLRDAAKAGLSRQTLDTLIRDLETAAKTATTLTFTLAAPVTAQVKEKLVGWCRTNIGETVLVTFQHNSTILGGAVLRYKSRVFDWSFRRAITDKASVFPEVLRRV